MKRLHWSSAHEKSDQRLVSNFMHFCPHYLDSVKLLGHVVLLQYSVHWVTSDLLDPTYSLRFCKFDARLLKKWLQITQWKHSASNLPTTAHLP